MLSHRGHVSTIDVRKGHLAFASSSDPDNRLADRLLSRGRLTLRQYLETGKAVSPGKRVGSILVEHGFLTNQELQGAIEDQVRQIIFSAFDWTEGRYRLEDHQTGSVPFTIATSTPQLILEGIHCIHSWGRIERAVGGASQVYKRAANHGELVAQMNLPPEKRAILEDLSTPRDVATICDRTGLPAFETCRLLWALRIVGAIQPVLSPA